MTAPHADQIIAGYMARLEIALAPLKAARRQELTEDVRDHIAEARGSLANETDADLMNILDRLGDPSETAAEELARQPQAAPAVSTAAGTPARYGTMEILAIVLLLFFWPAGVVLLWLSDAWSTRDKLIGTLVPPGGYLGLFIILPAGMLMGHAASRGCYSQSVTDSSGNLISSSSSCSGEWLAIVFGALGVLFFLFFLVGPIASAAYLGYRLRRSRRLRPQATPGVPAVSS